MFIIVYTSKVLSELTAAEHCLFGGGEQLR